MKSPLAGYLSFFPPLAFNAFKFLRYSKGVYCLHCLGRILLVIASFFAKYAYNYELRKLCLGRKLGKSLRRSKQEYGERVEEERTQKSRTVLVSTQYSAYFNT